MKVKPDFLRIILRIVKENKKPYIFQVIVCLEGIHTN